MTQAHDVGEWRITAELARMPGGGVYRAANAAGAEAVIKQLALQGLDDWDALRGLEREARLLAQLHHRRLPELIAWREQDGVYSLIQTALPGETLRGRRLDVAAVVGLAQQALALLALLHQRHPPLLHRDLKPSNLLLDDAHRLYLIDFGSACLGLEAGGEVAGTPAYMPAEQLQGRSRPASDLYALGVTLLELLGLPPAEQAGTDFRARLKLPVALANWLEILVHPRLELRFQDAREALEALPGAGPLSPELGPDSWGTGPALELDSAAVPQASARLLANRYRLLCCRRVEGGVSHWDGLDAVTEEAVEVKLLQLSRLNDAKQWQLFERELDLLQRHPDLPVPGLKAAVKGEAEWALVLEQPAGETLQQRLETGWRADEGQIWELAEAALRALAQLHAQGLVHRDLQPAHLLIQPQRVLLLNTGGVQQLFRLVGSSGSTVIGSFGYAPPEQLLGQATAASDLYALGMSLLEMLTGLSPAQLPWSQQRIELSGLGLSEGLSRWLAGLIAPDLAERTPTTSQALQALIQQRELYRERLKLAQLDSPAARSDRQQELQRRESRFREGHSMYVPHLSAGWIARFDALGLPLPPPRLELHPDTSRLLLTLSFARPARQPALFRRVQRLRWRGRALGLMLLPGLLGLLIHRLWPLSLLTLGLLLWNLQSWLSLRDARFADLALSLDAEALTCQALAPAGWAQLIPGWLHPPRALLRVPRAALRGCELTALADDARYAGTFYRLRCETEDGARLSAPIWLLPEEADWLQTALPVLLANGDCD